MFKKFSLNFYDDTSLSGGAISTGDIRRAAKNYDDSSSKESERKDEDFLNYIERFQKELKHIRSESASQEAAYQARSRTSA